MRILDRLRYHPLIAFFALSYAFSWPGWWLAAAGNPVGAFLGYFGPAIAAIVMAAITGGKRGLEELLARLFRWRMPFRWLAVAVLLPAGSVLLVVAILSLTGSAASDFDPGRLSPLLPQLASVLVFGALYGVFVVSGEELGWRGFALPALLKRHSAFIASLIVGIFWGLWHLPVGLLFSDGQPSFVDALLYGLGVDFASVIYTWMFQHTRGSLLIASLFHSVFDVSLVAAGRVAQAVPGVEFSFRIYVLVLAIIAGLIVVIAGPKHLSRRPLETV